MQNIVVGLDIGGTNSKVGLVNTQGEVLAYDSFHSFGQNSFEHFVTALKGSLQRLQAKTGIDEVAAIGVGAPNTNANTGRMEYAHNFKWGNFVPVVERLNLEFSAPVFATNDANAAAIGEQFYGAAKGMHDFIVVTLGTGFGSGIVIDNNLLNGSNGLAGEMGHINVKSDGRHCHCGKIGCLETYVSATGIKRTVSKLLADRSAASSLRAVSYDQLNGKMVTEAALAGDPIAEEAYRYTAEILGQKLADAAALFDPEAIILAGGLTKAGDLLLTPTRASFDRHIFPPLTGKVKILISKMEDANAAVQGAAALAWSGLKKSVGLPII
ncbi:MAG: ROK family protein [Saprospiraceae bacterium]